jgi:hypothetical protein
MLRFLVRVLAAGLAIAVAAIPEANAQEARGARTADNVVNVAGEPEGFPFSPAIKAGGMIYLSGQVGNLFPGRYGGLLADERGVRLVLGGPATGPFRLRS